MLKAIKKLIHSPFSFPLFFNRSSIHTIVYIEDKTETVSPLFMYLYVCVLIM